MSFQKIAVLALSFLFVSGCASSAMKARKDQQLKVAQSAKLYCEYVNGEMYPADIDVALNLEMAKRCDSEKPFSITSYKTPSENQGILYCCSTNRSAQLASSGEKAPAKAVAKPADKKEDKKEDQKDKEEEEIE